MYDGLTAALRAFYDLADQRDMEGLLARFHPAAVLRDHRHMASWGGGRQDWGAMAEGWWSLLPDARVVHLEVLGAAGDRHVHSVTIVGTDSITGGPAEFEFFVATKVADDMVVSCDFFDDEDAALEYFRRPAAG